MKDAGRQDRQDDKKDAFSSPVNPVNPVDIQDARQKIIAEAQTWLGTPWHHQAALKGCGVDCGQILMEVFADAGFVERVLIGQYSRQWMLHRDEEVYLGWVEQFAQRVDTPKPGDLAVWKNGRTYSHGAIVVAWPRIIHADVNEGVVWADASCGPLAGKPVLFYSIFGEDH
jgi:cell wall-associated NlpC family hydrolase